MYFSIVTQALTYAAMLLFFRNNTGFGGNNGLTDFKRILGFSLAEQSTKAGLFVCTALALLGFYLVCRLVTTSKLGRILTAVRDAESRVMFIGYDPLPFKLFVWTLSAVMCAVAGALYVPQVGIINPSEMHPANSIEIAIWVAVGGRGTLAGPLLGAFLVNGAKSWFTVAAPEFWLYFLGAIFIATTLFLPGGLMGLAGLFRRGGGAAAGASGREPGRRPVRGPAQISSAQYVTRDGFDSSSGVILYVEQVSVSFDGFNALTDLSLAIDEGSLHCIIGPNGAGKTTMLDIITGKTKPAAGRVILGQSLVLTDLTEWQIARMGVGRKFQKPTVFENLTLEENLELAYACDKGIRTSLFWKRDAKLEASVAGVLSTVGLADQRHRLAGLLSHGQKQWLEIGMLLMQKPKVLLLDEPGRRDDPARDRGLDRPAQVPGGPAHGGGHRARHGVRAGHRPARHRAARGPGAHRGQHGPHPKGPARGRSLPGGLTCYR